MVIKVTVKHNLRLVVREIDRILPNLREVAEKASVSAPNYIIGELEREAPPEAGDLVHTLSYRSETIDPDTYKGTVLSTGKMEAFAALEYGKRGVSITFDKPVPMKKELGEDAKKPVEKMSQKERLQWETERIVWTKRIDVGAQPPHPWLLPVFHKAFPIIVERLKNAILFRFIGKEVIQETPP